MSQLSDLFPDTYEASRDRFRGQMARIRARWPDVTLEQHRVDSDSALTIDSISAAPYTGASRWMVLTTGEHGIEGYVGSAMLQLFLEEFLGYLDPSNTALLLVHAINPWGMKHRRRTNADNVDLNRSFLLDRAEFRPDFNPEYARLDGLLNPRAILRADDFGAFPFLLRLLSAWISLGPTGFRTTSLQGQYRFPQGLYYGGDRLPQETRYMIELYRKTLRAARHVVHIDIHTGYGPRDQMTLVNSRLEPRTSQDLCRRLAYPLVAQATVEEFYPMQGDMIDCLYALRRDEFPETSVFGTAFEFGTLGSSLWAALRSLRTMIWENQAHWHGTDGARTAARVRQAFEDLYAPSDPPWRRKAVEDARLAFRGILTSEGLIPA